MVSSKVILRVPGAFDREILFGIAEDVLGRLFTNCVSAGTLTPMQMRRGTNFPTHILYADDVLVFCHATVNNARTIQKILDYYGQISDQIVSQDKSQIFFTNKVPIQTCRAIRNFLRFPQGNFPINYLGVPIFKGRVRASYLRPIQDRVINKFARWKGLHLSMAGRLCLIRSVIQSSLTHAMMVYRWPTALIKELDACCRNFLWTGNIKQVSSCSVSWNRVCSIKEEGGLGVRSFELMNKSYLMKMAWKVVCGCDFGYDLIRDRYLDCFGRRKPLVAASTIWMGLREEIDGLVADSYSHIGDGVSTSF
ncbi:uncharacterized protein LOC131026092 [Salvia miltiorrhiza]|uniref:uncharacterized protein LOC131026092 n=1 Tax=Salvia miltiorrhiza TaxID=226208 RepID=UPI0025AB92D0|nr:uncharacterized protein LOC131026092 [Salvia miltiorrhiza]